MTAIDLLEREISPRHKPRDPVCLCGHGRSLHGAAACGACEAVRRAGESGPTGWCCVAFAESGADLTLTPVASA